MRSPAAWTATCSAISEHDPYVRGIVVLGLDAPESELAESFSIAASYPLVKGFAVGRTIFGTVARQWFNSSLSDDEAVAEMANRYERLCQLWDKARRAENSGE